MAQDGSRQKRADRIAADLEGKILAGGWPIGHRIGNEAELVRAHGVSRWTMREAIAILEQAGTVVARRGPLGGLYVSAPAQDLVRNNLVAYLELSHVDFSAIAETMLLLNETMMRRAAQLMSDAERIHLARLVLAAEPFGSERVEAVSQVRGLLRDLGRNSSMALFLDVLSDVVMHSCWLSSLDDDTFVAYIDKLAKCTRRQALAIIAAETDTAIALDRENMETMRQLYEVSAASGRFRSTPNALERAYAMYPSGRPAKKAERAAWTIREKISGERAEPGDIIGSEESLMQELKVGRPVLREAIRVLERLGIVEMRRGGASGLTVIAPNPSRVVRLAREHLLRDPPTDEERRLAIATLRQVDPANPVAAFMLSIIE